MPSLTPVSEQTLVITGASSGIGLATALEAAARGANLVLVSREPTDLEAAAERCRSKGAEVETVAADVADRATLGLVAERATERFGGFDTWVNNAGSGLYGLLWDIPEEDARQLFETNYWGTVHGSLVALEHFRQRTGTTSGALVNVGSVLSDRAIPLQGHYCASKHAIKGFTDALRMEAEKEGIPVSITLVKPSAINTPYVAHAANHMDKEPALPTPAYAPEVVARAILAAAEKPLRDITVGAKDGVVAVLGGLAPRLTDKIMESSFFDQQKADQPSDGSRGALHEPIPGDGRLYGDAQGHVFQTSAYTQLATRPKVMLGAGLAAVTGLVLALRRN